MRSALLSPILAYEKEVSSPLPALCNSREVSFEASVNLQRGMGRTSLFYLSPLKDLIFFSLSPSPPPIFPLLTIKK